MKIHDLILIKIVKGLLRHAKLINSHVNEKNAVAVIRVSGDDYLIIVRPIMSEIEVKSKDVLKYRDVEKEWENL